MNEDRKTAVVASPFKRIVMWFIGELAVLAYLFAMAFATGGLLYGLFVFSDNLGRIALLDPSYIECVTFCLIVSIASNKIRKSDLR